MSAPIFKKRGQQQATRASTLPAPGYEPPSSLQVAQQAVQRHTTRPLTFQRQAVAPVLRAASLEQAEVARVQVQRQAVVEQLHSLPLGEDAPVQREVQPVPTKPQTASDWVTVMRHQAEQVEGKSLDSRQYAQFTALQREVAQTLVQGFRSDRGPVQARYDTYGEHLATLQRHEISAPVSRVVLGMVPAGERLALQRAVEAAVQRREREAQQAAGWEQRQSLQRQLAELDAEATQPVLQRIQARRGGGNPLPEAVQRHLEQGLNHDLSKVRVHEDTEADTLAKGVNAVAFTTGTDIFFQSGRFNPNTQGGLELLAHEVTHTVQQAQGRVGPGVDPDAGLEAEARRMGAQLAQSSFSRAAKRLPTKAPQTLALSGRFAMQRQYQTPLVFSNAITHDQMFLGGHGQQWADAGAAARMALQMIPDRLRQQFKDMPEALGQGLLVMVRDMTLTLGISTTVGAVIGAFFGGVGAAPGAAIGFEVGQLVLTAWGIGTVLATLKSQLGSLGLSIRQFAALSKSANGNPQTIKQAAGALTNGILIVCNGLILALSALVLKQGGQWLMKSKLGTAIGAKASNSPSLVWLRQRQQLTALRGFVPTPTLSKAVKSLQGLTKTQEQQVWNLFRAAARTPNFKATQMFSEKWIAFNKRGKTDLRVATSQKGFNDLLSEFSYSLNLAKRWQGSGIITPGSRGPMPISGNPKDFDLDVKTPGGRVLEHIEIHAGSVVLEPKLELAGLIGKGVNHAAEKVSGVPVAPGAKVVAAIKVQFIRQTTLDLSKEGFQFVNDGRGVGRAYIVKKGVATAVPAKDTNVLEKMLQQLNDPAQTRQIPGLASVNKLSFSTTMAWSSALLKTQREGGLNDCSIGRTRAFPARAGFGKDSRFECCANRLWNASSNFEGPQRRNHARANYTIGIRLRNYRAI